MLEYLVRRLLLGLLTAALVSVLVFVILRIAPGDVVDGLLGGDDSFYSGDAANELREQLGLNDPLHVQYFVFMRDFLTFNWGTSLVDGKEIWPQITARLPVALQLSLMTVGISIILGIPGGANPGPLLLHVDCSDQFTRRSNLRLAGPTGTHRVEKSARRHQWL